MGNPGGLVLTSGGGVGGSFVTLVGRIGGGSKVKLLSSAIGDGVLIAEGDGVLIMSGRGDVTEFGLDATGLLVVAAAPGPNISGCVSG